MSAGQKIFPAFCGNRKIVIVFARPPPQTVAIQSQMNLIHTRASSCIKAILILYRSCELSSSDISIKTLLSPFSEACHVTCTLGAFAKLLKATVSFVMSALLSGRMQQLGSHETDFFNEISYLNIFGISVEKIQV